MNACSQARRARTLPISFELDRQRNRILPHRQARQSSTYIEARSDNPLAGLQNLWGIATAPCEKARARTKQPPPPRAHRSFSNTGLIWLLWQPRQGLAIGAPAHDRLLAPRRRHRGNLRSRLRGVDKAHPLGKDEQEPKLSPETLAASALARPARQRFLWQ